MAKKRSAGILPFRPRREGPELFLVHPGGPFWKNKDEGAWSIPKGEIDPNEDPLTAARREFREETSLALEGTFIELDPVTIASGKEILVWAIERDLDGQGRGIPRSRPRRVVRLASGSAEGDGRPSAAAAAAPVDPGHPGDSASPSRAAAR
jgi:8-oxo-dGTP pyrophosphatase MutT (NUDIX family)